VNSVVLFKGIAKTFHFILCYLNVPFDEIVFRMMVTVLSWVVKRITVLVRAHKNRAKHQLSRSQDLKNKI